MLRALPRPEPTTRPRKKRAARPIVLAQFAVLNPAKLGKLRAAVALGARLEVTFDGYGLTISAVPAKERARSLGGETGAGDSLTTPRSLATGGR